MTAFRKQVDALSPSADAALRGVCAKMESEARVNPPDITPLGVLRGGLALFGENGECWTRGAMFRGKDGESLQMSGRAVQFCAVGGCHRIRFGAGKDGAWDDNDALGVAVRALVDAGGLWDCGLVSLPALNALTIWNDNSGRKFSDVRALFVKAIRTLEKEADDGC